MPTQQQVKITTIAGGLLKGVKMVSLPGVERTAESQRPMTVNLVPYYSWENRGQKTMSVWIAHKVSKSADKPLTWIPASAGKPSRSTTGSNSAIVFENKSGKKVKVYWISYRGEKKLYGEITPGKTLRRNTYSDSRWLITDENDKPLGHFVVGESEARAVIPAQK